MAEEKDRREWDQSAFIVTLLANANRDPERRRKPWDIYDFHPYLKGQRPKPVEKSAEDIMEALASACGGGIEVVTEDTPWVRKKSSPVEPSSPPDSTTNHSSPDSPELRPD